MSNIINFDALVKSSLIPLALSNVVEKEPLRHCIVYLAETDEIDFNDAAELMDVLINGINSDRGEQLFSLSMKHIDEPSVAFDWVCSSWIGGLIAWRLCVFNMSELYLKNGFDPNGERGEILVKAKHIAHSHSDGFSCSWDDPVLDKKVKDYVSCIAR